MMAPRHDDQASDRRTQARIDADIPIKVKLPGRNTLFPAMNRDLSWGGAKFMIAVQPTLVANLTPDSAPLILIFPWSIGEQITIEASIVRVERLDDAGYQIAVRFRSLAPRSQARLERLLNMLHPHSDDSLDGETHLVRELIVLAHDASDMRRLLEQTTLGQITVNTAEYHPCDCSLRLIICGSDALPTVKLRARVASVEQRTETDASGSEPFVLRLDLEHPLGSLKQLADLLFVQLSNSDVQRR